MLSFTHDHLQPGYYYYNIYIYFIFFLAGWLLCRWKSYRRRASRGSFTAPRFHIYLAGGATLEILCRPPAEHVFIKKKKIIKKKKKKKEIALITTTNNDYDDNNERCLVSSERGGVEGCRVSARALCCLHTKQRAVWKPCARSILLPEKV